MITKTFLSIAILGLLAMLGLVMLTNTETNCFDQYQTEVAAIENCEQHE
jgi:hypothetical protein